MGEIGQREQMPDFRHLNFEQLPFTTQPSECRLLVKPFIRHALWERRLSPTFRHSAGNAVTFRARYFYRHRNRHLTNGKAGR